jgi:hypothetical protein
LCDAEIVSLLFWPSAMFGTERIGKVPRSDNFSQFLAKLVNRYRNHYVQWIPQVFLCIVHVIVGNTSLRETWNSKVCMFVLPFHQWEERNSSIAPVTSATGCGVHPPPPPPTPCSPCSYWWKGKTNLQYNTNNNNSYFKFCFSNSEFNFLFLGFHHQAIKSLLSGDSIIFIEKG